MSKKQYPLTLDIDLYSMTVKQLRETVFVLYRDRITSKTRIESSTAMLKKYAEELREKDAEIKRLREMMTAPRVTFDEHSYIHPGEVIYATSEPATVVSEQRE